LHKSSLPRFIFSAFGFLKNSLGYYEKVTLSISLEITFWLSAECENVVCIGRMDGMLAADFGQEKTSLAFRTEKKSI
jgi:hypothetical protein